MSSKLCPKLYKKHSIINILLRNIISQSGIDLLLNPKAKGFPKSDRQGYNNMSSMYEYGQFGMIDEYPQMDDRAFVDYITSKI